MYSQNHKTYSGNAKVSHTHNIVYYSDTFVACFYVHSMQAAYLDESNCPDVLIQFN